MIGPVLRQIPQGLAPISAIDFASRVGIALLLGSLIGIERQWRQRTAGLRTNALVAVGTSLFILITPLIGRDGNVYQIASYVVSGIGFLAGGVIFKERLSISGLNTAATLWCTAAIGELVGFGFIFEACIGVAAVLVANVVLRPLARFINKRPIEDSELLTSYEVHAVCRQEYEEPVRAALLEALRSVSLPLTAVYTETLESSARMEVIADVTASGHAENKIERVVARVAKEPGIVAASWRLVPTSADEQAVLGES